MYIISHTVSELCSVLVKLSLLTGSASLISGGGELLNSGLQIVASTTLEISLYCVTQDTFR